MLCPYCKLDKTKVVDTRKYDTVVIRIRFCESCLTSFQTEEQVHLHTPVKIHIIDTKIPKKPQ